MFPCSLRQFLPCFSLSFFLLTAMVHLQAEQETSATEESEHLVVTAHRISLLEDQIGSAVSVLDGEALERQPVSFVVDLLRDLPGVAVSRTSTYGSLTSVRVRGGESNHLLVLVDGVEANDPVGGNAFAFSSLTRFDVGRVELIRGPQSALWGAEASSGVINITTLRPSQPFSLKTAIEAGSDATSSASLALAAKGPKASISFQTSLFETDGDSAAASGTEEDGYENRTSGGRLEWEPTDSLRLNLAVRDRDSRAEYDGTDFATGLPADGNFHSEDDQRTLSALVGFKPTGTDWDHELRMQQLETDRVQHTDGDSTSSAHATRTTFSYLSRLQLPSHNEKWQHHLNWLVEREKTLFRQVGTASPFGDPNQRQSMTGEALAIEYITSFNDTLTLSGSLRQDWNSEFDDILTLRTTASWQFVDRVRLHSSYGEGQVAPTFTERFGFFPGRFIGNPDLQPESSRGFDLGLEFRSRKERLQFDVTWFREKLDQEINGFVFDSTQFRFTARNTQGTSLREGVELQAQAQLTAGLSLAGNYTYTDSRQPGGEGQETEIRRPRHMASFNLNQHFGDRLNINLNLSWTGEQLDHYFPPPTFAATRVTLDDYLLVGLTLQYQATRQIRFQLRGENLLDQDYTDVIGFRGPGSAIYASVQWQHVR